MKLMTAKAWTEKYFDAGSAPDPLTVRRWIANGDVPGQKVGGNWYVDEHAWLAGGDDLVARVLQAAG